MGHSDHFLSDFYEVSYPNSNFIKNQLGSPVDIPCDLPRYDNKNSQRHYYSHYAPTYSPTTTSVHDKQPLSHMNKVWSSHCHFNGVLNSPVDPIHDTLPSQAPPTFPASPSFWTDELPPSDPDVFITNDDGHGMYSDRKGDLLSPLNGFRLRDLPHNGPQASVGPHGVKERFREANPSFSPPEIPSSPDSPAATPYLSFLGEPWMDDESSSLASSISLSPDVFDLDKFIGEISVEEVDNENFYSSPSASPGSDTDHHPLEQYPLHISPHDDRFIPAVQHDDDDFSPLIFSPPDPAPLGLLSLPELDSSNINPPLPQQPRFEYSYSDYDPSTPVPSSPSLRRPATLPELEPTTFNTDSFGLHKSVPAEVPTSLARPPSPGINTVLPDIHLRSLPGCDTDDDLIPLELASKNYIPDPSAIVPTTSTGIRSLLLWDHNDNPDRSDIPTPRSPSPENFYLDPAMLAECADEEMQKVYELRQRTAKSEKWERERCRELSALLRLKLNERGVLGGGSNCRNHQSGSRSIPCCSDSSLSSSPSSDSFTVHQPQPKIHSQFSLSPSTLSSSSTLKSTLNPSSSSQNSTLPSTWAKPQAQSEGSKHQIRSMAQLVASMLFHRQSDVLRPHLSKKHRFEPTSSHSHPHPSSMGGAGMKTLPTPRSRLSKVTLPEELEIDQGAVEEAQSADGHKENEDVNVKVDDSLLSRSCMDMDLDENGNRRSHTVTESAPLCTHVSTQ